MYVYTYIAHSTNVKILIDTYVPMCICNTKFYLYGNIPMYVGPQHIPPTDDEATNPKYNTISDKRSKQPVNEPVGYYAEVIIPTAEVKMIPNPAYAVS